MAQCTHHPEERLWFGSYCLACEKELNELAHQAVVAQQNDTRTEAEKIRDGVAFIMDTRVGGP